MLTPYCEKEGVTLYHGDSLRVLHDLGDMGIRADGVVTDPPYSSGGLHRSDRAADLVSKYISTNARSAEYLPTFAGDNRDQRSYERWLSQIMAAAFRGRPDWLAQAKRARKNARRLRDWRGMR